MQKEMPNLQELNLEIKILLDDIENIKNDVDIYGFIAEEQLLKGVV